MKNTAFSILLILVLVSLALNAAILISLAAARSALLRGLDTSLESLSGLESQTFSTTVQIKQTVPVRANVPFSRNLVVPIRLNVPISQQIPFRDTLQIPLHTLVGDYSVSVPISTTIPVRMNVPISTTVPIAISETMSISTAIDIDMAIPVSIRIADTPLVTYLRDLRNTLAEIRKALAFGR